LILIGSRAAQYHFPNFRKPKDYDFIATSAEVDNFLSKFKYKDTSKHANKRRALIELNGIKQSFEFDLVEAYPSNKLIYDNDFNYGKYDNELKCSYAIASISTLFMLKKCCIIFPIHWEKNMKDFLFFQKHMLQLNSWQLEALELRTNEIKNKIKYKEMNFDISNSNFFKKSERFVRRKVPHDTLHYATCFYDKPLFLKVKKDLDKAAIDKSLVDKLSYDDKIKLIQEECIALSLERYILPAMDQNKLFDSQKAYYKITCKMIYHYLPLFLRHFAADNFFKILNLDIDYVNKFLQNKGNIYDQ